MIKTLEKFYFEILQKRAKKEDPETASQLIQFCKEQNIDLETLRNPETKTLLNYKTIEEISINLREVFKAVLYEIYTKLNLKDWDKILYKNKIKQIKQAIVTSQITNLDEVQKVITIQEINTTRNVLNSLNLMNEEIELKLNSVETLLIKEKQNSLINQLNNLIKETNSINKLTEIENTINQLKQF